MSVDNFDILTILGNSIDSPVYKVRHKETHQTFIWHTVDWDNKSEEEIQRQEDDIISRINLNHTHLLKFYNLIRQEASKICYIMTESCENLKTIIDKCLKNETYLSEELICRILYQIAVFLKTAEFSIFQPQIDDIFLDDNFNVKLYNFSFSSDIEEPKLSCLGELFFELCTLQKFEDNAKSKIDRFTSVYSTSLVSLITQMIDNTEDIKKFINKILCHPVVLLKLSQWSKDKCFLNFDSNLIYDNDVNTVTVGIGKLKTKEFALRIREQKLDKWEQELKHKTKEVLVLENTVKEKLQKAELYLKRCRKIKSVGSGSNLSEPSTKSVENNIPREDLNSTYVSCVDSVVPPTSKKLNVHEIIKPTPFTRTLSEKRIRFKGHSPLKDIDFNKKRTIKPMRQNRKPKNWVTCSEGTDRSSVDSTLKRSKGKLFPHNEELTDVKDINSCQPLVWTEQHKKQAFQLLRFMNSNSKENKVVKHTYL